MAPMAHAEWQVSHSLASCTLSQPVPGYGEATFEAQAGGGRRFTLTSGANPMQPGAAELSATAPSWNPALAPIDYGSVTLDAGITPLQIDGERVERLLDALSKGMVPQLVQPAPGAAAGVPAGMSLRLSPVNFLPAYRQYQNCVAQLAPVPVAQLQTAVLTFADEQTQLSAAARKRLDLLLRYAKSDRSVAGFQVVAVSADTPRRLYNLELARKRLAQVSAYLDSRGIAAGHIHGEYRGIRWDHRGERQRTVTIRVTRKVTPVAAN